LIIFVRLINISESYRNFPLKSINYVSKHKWPRTSAVLSTYSRLYCSEISKKVQLRAQTEMQAYWTRNMNGQRPWSPHLLIYKMELLMFTSLLHRGSGIAMAIGTTFLKVFINA